MLCKEDEDFITLYKGYPTEWDDIDWLYVSFDSVISLTGFKAQFKLGSTTKEFTNISQGFVVNLSEQETELLPLGVNYAQLIVEDTAGNGKPFTTAIKVLVKNWVQGDVYIDTFNMTVPVTLENEKQFTIKIETAKVSQEWVESLISAHNTSQQAHSYIQGLINTEASTRSSADTTLQNNITAEATTRASADASLSTAIDVETTDRQTADSQLQDNIDTVSGNLSTHTSDKTNPHEVTKAQVGLGNVANVDTSNASNITSGTLSNDRLGTIPYAKLSGVASSAQGANADNAVATIATYGNIVTHNTSEFATSAQGAKADSALQPTDVINDVTHTYTQKPLSALQGKELSDRIQNIANIGRYLSNWNAATGLPTTQPQTIPYSYLTGMYYVVSVIGATNYRPSGDTYTGQPSTTVETETLEVGDFYLYDGTSWSLLKNTGVKTVFENIGGSPYDNSNLAAALNAKQNTIDSTHKLSADLVNDSTTTNKFVTAQDKTNWDNKVDKNSPITAGTHTKITYDAKGLVTGGSDLTASDIPDLSATYYSASNPNGYQTAQQVNTTVTSYHDSTKYDASNPDGYQTQAQVNTAVTSYHDSTKQDVIDSSHKLSADLIADGTTNKVVTQTEKNTWNNKQDALGYTPENSANKVTSISSSSTNTQYPSAKCVYDELATKQATGNYAKTDSSNTFLGAQRIETNATNGLVIKSTTSGGYLVVSRGSTDSINMAIKCGASGGTFGTTTNHEFYFRTNDVNRLKITNDGYVLLVKEVPADSNSKQVASTEWVNDRITAELGNIETAINAIRGV